MDMSQLMQMAGQLKEQLGQAQQKAAATRATGEAGGGLVRVEVNGEHKVLAVHIDPTLLAADGKDLLEDLLVAATNQAVAKVSQAVKDDVGNMAQAMGIDPSALSGLG